jgi:secondary thiamine-phosphate synthase enzyme
MKRLKGLRKNWGLLRFQVLRRLYSERKECLKCPLSIYFLLLLTFKNKTMKSFRKELWFNIPQRRQLVNITPEVSTALKESGIQEGLCLINAMHISASVFSNDDESGLHQDFEVWLEKLAPEKPYSQYRHNGYEDNADAHLKRTIMGREVVVAVTGRPT